MRVHVAAAAGIIWLCPAASHGQPPDRRAAMVKRPVDLSGVAASRILISPERTRAIAPEARTAEIHAGEYVVAARAADRASVVRPTMFPGAKAWSLPYDIIGVTPDGRSVHFRPVVEAPGGFHATGSASGFKALVYVGLQDMNDPASVYDLPGPVNLLVGAQADEVTPRQFPVTHTNLPFAEVSILSENPGDALEVSVQASGTTEQARVRIPVLRPRLEVRPARQRIQGLGLEESGLVVSAVGLSDAGGRIVSVTSDIGSVNPIQVTLDKHGTGSTKIRSVSVGVATITATSAPFSEARAPIRFTWPFAFLVAAMIGGAAGAYLKQRQRAALSIKRRGMTAVIVTGVITGIVVVALYAVGVNVLPIHPSAGAGEALVFAVAAAGGYLGLRL